MGLPKLCLYQEAFNSDAAMFGGGDMGNMGWVQAEDIAFQGRPASAYQRLGDHFFAGLDPLVAQLGHATIRYATERGNMAAHNVIHIPEELLIELQAKAAAVGKSVDEFAAEALRKGLEERSWDDLFEYGRERGREAGFTEREAADVVHEWRKGG